MIHVVLIQKCMLVLILNDFRLVANGMPITFWLSLFILMVVMVVRYLAQYNVNVISNKRKVGHDFG